MMISPLRALTQFVAKSHLQLGSCVEMMISPLRALTPTFSGCTVVTVEVEMMISPLRALE